MPATVSRGSDLKRSGSVFDGYIKTSFLDISVSVGEDCLAVNQYDVGLKSLGYSAFVGSFHLIKLSSIETAGEKALDRDLPAMCSEGPSFELRNIITREGSNTS